MSSDTLNYTHMEEQVLKRSLKLHILKVQIRSAQTNNNKNYCSWEPPKANLQIKITDTEITLADYTWNMEDNLWYHPACKRHKLYCCWVLDTISAV